VLFKATRVAKKASLAAYAAGLATVASLVLIPASPALAAPACTLTTSGGVTFKVCIEKRSAGWVWASIVKTGGTYVSGHLNIYRNGTFVRTGCDGQWTTSCGFDYAGSSGSYHSRWVAAGGGGWNSPAISA